MEDRRVTAIAIQQSEAYIPFRILPRCSENIQKALLKVRSTSSLFKRRNNVSALVDTLALSFSQAPKKISLSDRLIPYFSLRLCPEVFSQILYFLIPAGLVAAPHTNKYKLGKIFLRTTLGIFLYPPQSPSLVLSSLH